MIDLYLKFESAEQAQEVLTTAGVWLIDEETKLPYATEKFAVDVIGDIYRPTGETTTDEDGFENPVMEKLEGYHINIRALGAMPTELNEYAVTPKAPTRKWA